ncbi:MAG: NAD-binding protein, partial [Lentisphaeria bacterium]|nr:NAD-binding protein [Lentisphaeria bacterium]
MSGNYFAVFGLGAFGTRLAVELSRAGNHVTVVDLDRDRINDIRDKVTEAVIGDISSEEVIREMNVKKGLDWFPLDTRLDDKFELIEAEFGAAGFAVVIKLLQRI